MGDCIDVDSTQNIISFCTGYGGIEDGIRRAGVDVRTVCNVEIEAFVQANLVAKTEEGRMDNAPIYSDLKTFPARIFRGKIHGLIGGYPCQPFSSAGKRKGEEDPRHLWPYIREHVRAVRPVWCFFENVRGHTTMGLWRVLSDLEEDGYRTEWGLFSAEETGAPHQRIRVFILAHRGCIRSTIGVSGQVAGQEGQSEEFNHDSGGQLVNPASEGLEGCARESVQGRSEGFARTNGAELGDPAKHGRGSHQSSTQTEREGEEGRLSEPKRGCSELGDSEHNGLHGDSVSGGSGEDRERSEEGKKASEQSEGASGQEDLRHLQGAELANTASREPRQSQARNGGQDIGGGSEEELANSEDRKLKLDSMQRGQKGAEWREYSIIPRLSSSSGGSEEPRWPARPGEEQYEWEEPRVTEAQSELGGATNGLTHRVDRLRLLGNGVVPQTAELAWKSLWRKMDEDNNH